MRLVLGLSCLILSTYIGYKLSNKFSELSKFYNDYLTFNNKLKNEIYFMKTTVVDLVKNINTESCFNGIIFNRLIINNKINKPHFLSDDEWNELNSYINSIGQGDSKAQEDYLDSIGKKIEIKYNSAILNEKKYKKLYLKLGFLFGLIIMIVIL